MAGKPRGPGGGGELDVGDVEDGRAPDLVLAPDVVEVAVRGGLDAAAGLGQERVALPEDRGLRGTGRGAGGLAELTAGEGVVAQDALADPGDGRVPLVPGHAERAGHHAVAAAHADVGVVGHGPGLGGVQGAHRTGGGAGGIQAVPALDPDVAAPGAGDRRPAGGAELLGPSLPRPGGVVVAGLVGLLAGGHALLAADAEGDVGQDREGAGVWCSYRLVLLAQGEGHVARRSRPGSATPPR